MPFEKLNVDLFPNFGIFHVTLKSVFSLSNPGLSQLTANLGKIGIIRYCYPVQLCFESVLDSVNRI